MLLQQLHGEGMAVFRLGAGTGHWEPGKIESLVQAGTLWESLALALLSGLTVITELWNGLCWEGLLRTICSLCDEQDPSCRTRLLRVPWTKAFCRASLCTAAQEGNSSSLRCWHSRDIFIFLLARMGYISSSWKLFLIK